MADISMCQYSNCQKAKDCYRFRAIADKEYQSYNLFENICNDKNSWQWFMNIGGYQVSEWNNVVKEGE